MNYYILIILEIMFFYMNENKIHDIEYLYQHMLLIFYGIMFVGLVEKFIRINFFYYKNKFGDYLYTSIYDYFFGNKKFIMSTPNLFLYSLNKFEPNSRVLDFGCGSGIYYSNENIKKIIVEKNLKIQGIDIDKIYIEKCVKRIEKEKLTKYVSIKVQDIFKYNLEQEEKFDYIIFSESAPLLSNGLLVSITKYMIENLLKPNGKIVFINNLTENSTPLMKKLKPALKYLCMIDFGRVLTRNEFENLSNQVNKNIEINLIAKMKIIDILNYFKLEWTYHLIWKIIGIKNYDVEQYEIILY
jgi:SAM-dependent methyltransferase